MSADISVDELISTLNHSNAPTLILEGKDDYVAFEEFERNNVEWGFTVIAVKGRRNVINLLDRRDEIENPCIYYLMDQDEWCFTGIPNLYIDRRIGYTSGASIENELIIDGNPMAIMKPNEVARFWSAIQEFEEIFLRLCYNHINCIADHSYGSSLRLFFDENLAKLPEWTLFCDRCPNAVARPAALNVMEYLRGKTLLELVVMILSNKNRASKYSKANIMELGARARGAKLLALEAEIYDFFRNSGCISDL
jgi:hypothetical protein